MVYYYEKGGTGDCDYFFGENTGEIIFTKYDEKNKIVSGKFQFSARCSDISLNPIGDSIAPVTDGRFDIGRLR